jgi:hypothetical protein
LLTNNFARLIVTEINLPMIARSKACKMVVVQSSG